MMHDDTPSPPIYNSDDDEQHYISDEEIEIIDFNSEDEHEIEEQGAIAQTDDSQLIFDKHSKAVFCCELDPKNGEYCVSGGEDDTAYVWNRTNGSMLFECVGHKDSVVSVGFNHDASFVASGDMSGIINVWKVETAEKIWDFEISELRWLEWHPKANVLIAGSGEGEAWMWRIPSGTCKTFQTFGSGNECGKIMPDGNRAVMGYGDGKIRIWDLKAASVIHAIIDDNAHTESVTTIDCYNDNNLIVTGSTDGTAKLSSSNTGKVLTTFQCAETERNEAVESVGFSTTHPLIAAGTVEGLLTIWDIPTHIQRKQFQHPFGISKLLWDFMSPLIYTAGLDGIIRMFDGRSGDMERQWKGHKAEILDISFSKGGQYFLTSSEDSTCRLFYTN